MFFKNFNLPKVYLFYLKFKQKIINVIFCFCLKSMNYGNGGVIESSGEINVIKYINNNILFNNRRKKKFVIFDVGSCEGQYIYALINNFKNNNYQIHAFEPSDRAYEILKKNTKKFKNIKINKIGISDKVFSGKLYTSNKLNWYSSLYKREHDKPRNVVLNRIEKIKITTIDNYCKDNKIKYVDFLKLDVEGNELNCLKGAKKMLTRCDYVQFEFGGCNIDSRTYFYDFWKLLNKNFTFFKIMKNYLFEIESYNEKEEIFLCTNYFLINKKIKII